MLFRTAAFLAITLVACGAGQRGPQHSRFRPGWYVVRFTHAVLPSRRADNTPWHTTARDNGAAAIGGVVGLAVGSPSLGLTVGKALANPGGDPLAPAPYIVMKLGTETFHVSPIERSYSPTWDQPIALDARASSGNERVLVQVMDAVDSSLIGQHETTLAELVSQPSRTLTAVGPVASLDISVQPMPPREPQQYELSVPAEATLEALLRGYGNQWEPIPVMNGDSVEIDALGKVCPFGDDDDCYGPQGVDGNDRRGQRYASFETAPFASLVAVFPDGSFFVGTRLARRVATSGRVMLFVNDARPRTEGGGFLVRVHVVPASQLRPCDQ